MLYKNDIFLCMGKIFCVEFQRINCFWNATLFWKQNLVRVASYYPVGLFSVTYTTQSIIAAEPNICQSELYISPDQGDDFHNKRLSSVMLCQMCTVRRLCCALRCWYNTFNPVVVANRLPVVLSFSYHIVRYMHIHIFAIVANVRQVLSDKRSGVSFIKRYQLSPL